MPRTARQPLHRPLAPESRASLHFAAADWRAVKEFVTAYTASDAWRGEFLTGIEDVLQPYRSRYEAASPPAQRAFMSALQARARAEPALAVLLLSFLFDVSKDPSLVPDLLAAVAARDDLPPHRHYNLFLHLTHLLMMNRAAFSPADYAQLRQKSLRPLFAQIMRRLRRTVPEPLAPYRADSKKVLVIANAINNPRFTGPLWDALEYAHALRQDFGLEPLLVNSNIWLQAMTDPIWPLRCYTTPPGKQWDAWPHRGGKQPLYRTWEPMPSPPALADFFVMVREHRPALAIVIGDLNAYAELLAEHVPTYVMHFTVDFPITLRARPTYHPNLPETAPAIRRLASQANSNLVQLVPSYSVQGRYCRYERQDFGIKPGDFVYAVVGHRLDSEVTAAYLQLLENLLVSVPQGFVCFLGLFPSYQSRVAAYPALSRRSAFIGNVGDVASFMQIVDVYLNPDRAGGGSSAVYALAAGVPVLTLPQGDVAFAAGAAHHCVDYAALLSRAQALAADPVLRRQARRLAAARAAALCQRDVNMRLILQDAGIAPINPPGKSRRPRRT